MYNGNQRVSYVYIYVYMIFRLQEDLLLSEELFVKKVQQCDNLRFS